MVIVDILQQMNFARYVFQTEVPQAVLMVINCLVRGKKFIFHHFQDISLTLS